MSLRKLGGRVAFLIASAGLLAVYGFRIPRVFSLILTVLYFVLYGYLVERSWLPRELWPFKKQLNLQDLAISAAFLVAALASTMGVLLVRTNHGGMLFCGLLMGMFCIAGTLYLCERSPLRPKPFMIPVAQGQWRLAVFL